MYPYIRLTKELIRQKFLKKISLSEVHTYYTICWPIDLDPWWELNNGRTLTLYDLGRISFLLRTGLKNKIMKQGCRFTVAGSSIRYRKRITMFSLMKVNTRFLGWDERFIYFQQTMWRKNQPISSILIRSAITDANGIVTSDRFESLMGLNTKLKLPDWATDWSKAEAKRTWPPEI